ncbi:MAG: cation-translocating P-type ATPase [Candidatus Tectomicrobia bacterium]|nr:cation-translocating P-type ATPase [Candidatus Tectomicrobia bacterium]
MSNCYNLDAVDVLQQLGTDAAHGLGEAEIARRLAKYGPNALIERGLKSPWLILWEQLTALMVIILILAAVASALLGDYKNAGAIMVIVVLNALLGLSQEYRAEKAMAALRKLAVPAVKVRRSGHVQEVSAHTLVPGDIVLLEAGNLVPADCRLLECANLRIQEATLTGESEPVEKISSALTISELPLGERRNMAYMGTLVTYGHGLVVVTETGMATELGRIAEMIQTVEREPTPLQRRLEQLGRSLAVVALTIVTVVFFLGLFRGESVKLMFLTAVSLAVAAVPEGLPAVVTIALALGAQRMLKRRVLIRKLPAVETLGSVTVTCSDKTGTLTENRMTVTILDVAGHRIDLSESTQQVTQVPGSADERPAIMHDQLALALLLTGGALCNDALLESDDEKPGDFRAVGDPTEAALVVAAARSGLSKAELEPLFPRVAEVPFTSERKRMTTVHQCLTSPSQLPEPLEMVWHGDRGIGASYVAFTKGAVDSLLDVSSSVWVNDHTEPLMEQWRKRIVTTHDQLAENGMRVLGVAFRPLKSIPPDGSWEALERELTFIGMVGMIDPPRAEVKDAVRTCKAAGIRPVMITGDHPLTAWYIARELGIADDGRLQTAQDLDRLSLEGLEEIVEEVSVYARVSPEHKLKIVQALQNRGHIVAMTGDGVNDAPALKKADIGVAMGITGTDVTKEAADMVLLDDNFATIVAAVEEGRIIYDNIRRFIKYLLSCNSGELWVLLLAPLFGMPLPLLPLQILWMNLVTDGLPALALGVEGAERDTMRRPPYPPTENIFSRGMGWDIIWIGWLLSLISLGIGYWYWSTTHTNWQTMLFTTLTLSQMTLALSVRSERDTLFRIGFLSNKLLLGAVVITFLLQLGVVYIPSFQELFKTEALSIGDLALSLALSSVVFWGVELKKWLLHHKKRLIFP